MSGHIYGKVPNKYVFYVTTLFTASFAHFYQDLKDDVPDTSELDNKNALALAIVPLGNLLFNISGSSMILFRKESLISLANYCRCCIFYCPFCCF